MNSLIKKKSQRIDESKKLPDCVSKGRIFELPWVTFTDAIWLLVFLL